METIRKLILILLLLIGGVAKSQTYTADTLVYFSNVYNEIPDTVLVEPINIVIEGGYILITKRNARFKARIVDTLPPEKEGFMETKYFTLKKPTVDTSYTLTLIMTFYDNYLVAIGLSHNLQLFIYHIQNQLISTYIKPKEDVDIRRE